MDIALFDFDKTLYKKDSTLEFTKFVYRRYPQILWYLIVQALSSFAYLMGFYRIENYKQLFYGYMRFFTKEEQKELIAGFWENHYPVNFRKSLLLRISELNELGVNCIVVTAAPDFLLNSLKGSLGVKEIIATPFKVYNGAVHIMGNNCKGPEKVVRLKARYDFTTLHIVEAYSDNKDDWYMLSLADKSVKL